MKMKAEHQERLLAACKGACANMGRDIATVFQLYKEACAMPHSRVYQKNHVAICMWDIFHAACRMDKTLLDDLYTYLNDSHIETALKRVIVPADL